jgi:hypothetical protein
MMTAKTCIACGMPLEHAEDHALGDPARDYCRHCARADGTMQSYSEKLAGFTHWLVSTQGLDHGAAHQHASAVLAQLPAWRGTGAAGPGAGA